MYARWLESRLPQKGAKADDPETRSETGGTRLGMALTKMWKFCPPIAILIIVSFL